MFEDSIKKAVEEFRNLKPKVVRIIANQDADGVTSASILIKALEREGIKFVCSIARQVNKRIIEELKKEEYNILFFCDLGSKNISLIEEIEKPVFIFDHHMPEKKETKIVHLNPYLDDVNGLTDISAAGIAYIFARELNHENRSEAYLAIVGAIGDAQEKIGFSGYNQDILDEAIVSGKIKVLQDLRIFGMQTKPLHKAFEYSTSPYIPGVTGDERSAIRFLEDIGISVKDSSGRFRRLKDLNDNEVKNLITAIATRRFGSDDSDELYGPVYILQNEDEDSITRDAREFSSLLNCCVRMNKAGLAIGTCLGSIKSKEKAIALNRKYMRDIIDSLNWFYSNKGKESVLEGEGYVLINAEENVGDILIGTLCSLISRSNVYDDGVIVIGLAHGLDDTTKISARIGGINKRALNAGDILSRIVKGLGGNSGGHSFAAGATIKKDKEQEFLKAAKELLEKEIAQEIEV